MDAAFEPDGKAEKISCRKEHRSAPGGRTGLDGAVDRCGIQRLAVAFGAIVANIEEEGCGMRWRGSGGLGAQQRQTQGTAFHQGAAMGDQIGHPFLLRRTKKRTAWARGPGGFKGCSRGNTRSICPPHRRAAFNRMATARLEPRAEAEEIDRAEVVIGV